MASSPSHLLLLLLATTTLSLLSTTTSANLWQDLDVTWGDGRGKISTPGDLLTLSLDHTSGSGFQSKNEYLYGKIEMQIKLVPGNSAGTVTTFYLSSQGPNHDEIDFEFLGNTSGNPYTIHTNVYAQGKGSREQQFHLWFDPTKEFHNYAILWNPQHVIFSIDGTPIRDFKNNEAIGATFPKNQPMRLYASLWNADDWATQGGRVKTDWSQGPFTASYRNFRADACVAAGAATTIKQQQACPAAAPGQASANGAWFTQELDSMSYRRMRWVQRKFMIYDYCSDVKRFPQGLPAECTRAARRVNRRH